jgi:hypothetical protein
MLFGGIFLLILRIYGKRAGPAAKLRDKVKRRGKLTLEMAGD